MVNFHWFPWYNTAKHHILFNTWSKKCGSPKDGHVCTIIICCMLTQDGCFLVQEIGFKWGEVRVRKVCRSILFWSNQSVTHFITVSVQWKSTCFNKRPKGGTRTALLFKKNGREKNTIKVSETLQNKSPSSPTETKKNSAGSRQQPIN